MIETLRNTAPKGGDTVRTSVRGDTATVALPPRPEIPDMDQGISLYRGQWIESPLKNEQIVRVGGTLFSDDLTIKVKLDLAAFADGLDSWIPKASALVNEKRDTMKAQLDSFAIQSLDPELVLIAVNVQRHMEKLLRVDHSTDPEIARSEKYRADRECPSLSDFRGYSMCAERALLAKHILDRLDVPAAYMSGVAAFFKQDGTLSNLTDHSFVVLQRGERSVIFDVARPHASGWPRLVVMDRPFSAETFTGFENLLISGRSPFSSSEHKEVFGVGHPLLAEEPNVVPKSTE